jgi:soluble lytic murein transglycosylase
MKYPENFKFPSFGFKTVFLPVLVFFLLLVSTGSGEGDAREYFNQGRKDFESMRYTDAIRNFSLAQTELPQVGDYILYYLAEAYYGLGEHKKSLETVQTLLDKFPDSPLKKKARMAEIRAKKETGSDIFPLYEMYVKDYQDSEALFLYGKLLLENGNKEKAIPIFRKLYVDAGEFSEAAFKELRAEDISTADLIARSSNLFRGYNFSKAEHELREALASHKGSLRTELLSKLGHSLFRQKKYREAAEVFGKVNDVYFQARSFYRAGNKKAFETVLSEVVARKDTRAGYLLNTVAADKRREKDFEGAISIYNQVVRNYPPDAEEALWGIGWTQYLSGDYGKATATFSQLYEKYGNLRYLYWKAKSLESEDRPAAEFYNTLLRADNSFYSVLTYAMNKEPLGKPVSLNPPSADTAGENIKLQSERIDTMISLDLRKEAIQELVLYSGKVSSPSVLGYFISKFQELGEFKRAIVLANRLPYSERMHTFWYPLAYWENVEPIANKYKLDPLVALSVMREESHFDTNAKSIAGAYGLMQLMPETAYRLDRHLKLGVSKPSHLTVPRNNIHLGSFYLKSLFNEFNSLPHVLAAYNAGELAVRKWQERGNYRSVDEFIEDIPYPETRDYVKKVLTSYYQYKKISPGFTEGAVLDIVLREL